ncbi:MAG TPA: hypothetical protein VK832_11175 [Burkholderiaceae bacterium]|jgi:hypothetical protein|nr:hypothetical protein [Burkholderiaceae bacterium]
MYEGEMNIKVARDGFDRRNGHHIQPPYLTDEGFVLIDRRASPDRRVEAHQGIVVNMDSAIKSERP